MKHIRFIAMLFVIILAVAHPFDWPLDKKNVVSSFCENTGDGFSPGISLAGDRDPVYPIADGEIIFSHEEGDDSFSLPYGLGSFVSVWHEGGIQSVYCQLEKGSLDRKSTAALRGKRLGVIGQTGSAIGGNLKLIIFNIEENEILNPVKNLVPFFEDRKKPVIRDFYIIRETGTTELVNNQEIEPGKAELAVEAFDVREDTQRIWEIAPYQIMLFHNGQKINQITFDSIREKGNKQLLSGDELQFSAVYEGRWMYKLGSVDLHEGISHIQVRVRDFAGNTESREIFLTVRKP